MEYSAINKPLFLVVVLSVTVTFARDYVTEETILPNNPFVSIWNAPSEGCHTHFGVSLNLSYFDIVANKDETFEGDEIVIYYQLGLFPYYDGKDKPVHGGLPQLGNLSSHLARVQKDVNRYIPNPKFTGLAVIDWESWRPIFERNHYNTKMRIYIRESENLVRKAHPEWPEGKVYRQAAEDFESAARTFMLQTLKLCTQMRPHGKWGYYGFPSCYNYGIGQKECADRTKFDNDRLSWLFNNSGAILSSVYLAENFGTIDDRRLQVFGELQEALRVRGNKSRAAIIPYSRFKYRDTGKFYLKGDLQNTIQQSMDAGLAGIALWGSSASFRSKSECQAVRDYVDGTLGPFVKNTTLFAQNCSTAVCNSHGRCVRRGWNEQTQDDDLTGTVARILKYYIIKMSNQLCLDSVSRLFRKLLLSTFWELSSFFYKTDVVVRKTVTELTSVQVPQVEKKSDSGDYTCRCYYGWSGEFCQKNNNEF